MTSSFLTFGHGRLEQDAIVGLLANVDVELVVDVRTFPGSRRNPHVARHRLEQWLPEAGIGYRWEPRLGGRRRPGPGNRHHALRNEGFRGYAEHMETPEFSAALDELLSEERRAAVMCSEAVWWRCHRRLVADAATVLRRARVIHLMHARRLAVHITTPGLRAAGDAVIYDDADTSA